MKAKIFLIDFYDSFTRNIACELSDLNLKVHVLSWRDAHLLLSFTNDFKQRYIVIYGPGPGHVLEYRDIFEVVTELKSRVNVFQVGICLGHQLLWSLKGFDLKASINPMHGQKIKISLPKWQMFFDEEAWNKDIFVQRYNSLVVDIPEACDRNMLFHNGELMASYFDRELTYQFHPESVGTSCPAIFFSWMKRFLYNDHWYGQASKDYWHLRSQNASNSQGVECL